MFTQLRPALTRGAAALAAAILGLPLGGCSASNPGNGSGSTPSAATENATPARRTADPGRDIAAQPPAKTWQEALTAARAAFPGDPVMIQLERRSDGRLQYEIDLVSDTEKYEVDLDADTLDKTVEERDHLGTDTDAERSRRFDPAQLPTSLDRAIEAARSGEPGSVHKWKIEGNAHPKRPRVYYEIEIDRGDESGDSTVKIDAENGLIIQD